MWGTNSAAGKHMDKTLDLITHCHVADRRGIDLVGLLG